MRFFLLFAALVVGAYGVWAAFKYTRLIANIFVSLVYRPADELPLVSRGEKVNILDSSDREIEGLLLECQGASRAVIFCHESGGAKESWEKYAYFVPALGYHLLSVDFENGRGEEGKNSLSQWPTREDVERLLVAVRWAKKALGPDIKIALFGVSNGADIAFAASLEDPSVRAVVADGLFSMKEIFRDYIRKWAPVLVRPNFFGENTPDWVVHLFAGLGFWYSQRRSGRRFVDVEDLMRKPHPPTLMIYGETDDYIPSSHREFLGRAGRSDSVKWLVVPGAGHNESVILGRESYEKEIMDFLGRV
ncbi:MAG: hypothetical protein HYT89_03605 [Candidatus Omnitrophica bacterium]|nr:hypothetical protein [Candidatus Omnitrophota bacterium]